jgi:hypothetical protein
MLWSPKDYKGQQTAVCQLQCALLVGGLICAQHDVSLSRRRRTGCICLFRSSLQHRNGMAAVTEVSPTFYTAEQFLLLYFPSPPP